MTERRKKKWALVGSGAWASAVHAPCLAAHPEVDFVGVWARDPAKAATLAADQGVRCFESYDALLSAADAVSFALAPAGQAELAPRALASGVDMLLEKPAGIDPDVVEAMARGRRPDQHVTVFMTRLFDPVWGAWLRSAIDVDADHAELQWISAAMRPGSPFAGSGWRQGAGIVWDVLPHVFSQVGPVLGDVVRADVRPWHERDGVIIDLTHERGGTSDVRVTLMADPADKTEWLRFHGAGGETRSPPPGLDRVAAYNAALATVITGESLADDPLLRCATLDAAVIPTRLMSHLAARIAGGLQ